MNIGIIGSSHSTGAHQLSDGSLTPTFLSWCEKYKSNSTHFYSCANGGKGSEMFLNSIVHLKEAHDVGVMLIEIIHNRRNINADLGLDPTDSRVNDSILYREALTKLPSIRDISADTFPYLKLFRYKGFISEELEEFSIIGNTYQKAETNWKTMQMAIGSHWDMVDFWTILDVYQSLKLCKMLGIKTVLWQNSGVLERHTTQFNELKTLCDIFVTLDEYECSRHYFESKYGSDIICDVAHIKPEYESELIKNFLMPAIDKLTTNKV
jgi:hypothetical protein